MEQNISKLLEKTQLLKLKSLKNVKKCGEHCFVGDSICLIISNLVSRKVHFSICILQIKDKSMEIDNIAKSLFSKSSVKKNSISSKGIVILLIIKYLKNI